MTLRILLVLLASSSVVLSAEKADSYTENLLLQQFNNLIAAQSGISVVTMFYGPDSTNSVHYTSIELTDNLRIDLKFDFNAIDRTLRSIAKIRSTKSILRYDRFVFQPAPGNPVVNRDVFCSNFNTWDGIWYNELGSCMKLSTYPSTNITGLYVSPKASGSEAARGTVAGQYKLDDDTFSFSVTWHNYPSTTGWAGEYKYDASSKPVLYTTWLLVSKTESIGDLWGNTLVGKDTFARDPFVDNGCETFLVDQRKTEL